MFNPELDKYLLACGSDHNDGCKRKWITRDGQVLAIEEMSNEHLINSMLKVQRDWPWRFWFYHCLVNEMYKRKLI